jgi:hypothetical protein
MVLRFLLRSAILWLAAKVFGRWLPVLRRGARFLRR